MAVTRVVAGDGSGTVGWSHDGKSGTGEGEGRWVLPIAVNSELQ